MGKTRKRHVQILFSLTIIFILFAGINLLESADNKSDEIIWLEFKLPPHYDAERKEIQEADAIRLKEEYKNYEEKKKKYESKYRSEYEKMYSYNPEFLKRNPYKYQEFKAEKINYDIIAAVDINGDGANDNAFVVAEIIKEGKFIEQARIKHYKKEANGFWKLFKTIATADDIGIKKSSGEYVISGCKNSEIFIKPNKIGTTIDIIKESKKTKTNNRKITSIVRKELKAEIRQAKLDYKKETNIEYKEELRIAGIFQDVNGDSKLDIIVALNDPQYMYMYPGGKKMPTGSRFQLFCLGEKGCEHYLLLNEGDTGWEKRPLGYTTCIGISNPNDKGVREIYAERSIAVWDGSKYKVIPYKPNWAVIE